MSTCRPLQPVDGQRLAQLDADNTEYPWPAAQYQRVAEAVDPHRWGLVLEDSDNSLVGFVLCEQVLDEASVLNLVVARSHRREGRGRQLMEAALTRMTASGAAACHLEVRAGNEAAISLYQDLGFARTGLRRGYYRDGATREDALVFTLPMESNR